MVLIGCQPAPAPATRKAVPVVNTMPAPVTAMAVARIAFVPPSAWRVRWEYPYTNVANVGFEVFASENLLEWTPATNTLILEVAFPNKKSEFFKVRAVDLVTGDFSEWGTTPKN